METFRIELELPNVLLSDFYAQQQAREAARLGWKTLEDYLVDLLLTAAMREHQRACERQKESEDVCG